MNRVLFVDDEQQVLDGIQNLLRKHRKRWDMQFLLGGEAALAAMKVAPADVVVSDMRMPGVDGAALLTRIKAEYPRTVRVVLSGHADKDALLRVLPVAHQFLGKPCDANVLQSMLERTFSLAALLKDDRVRTLAGSENILPSPPAIYAELTGVLADEKAGIRDVAKIVERDPAMCLRVLQLVNSAYFGLREPVSSVERGVSYLGLESIRGLALVAHVMSALGNGVSAELIDQVQRHSLLTARLARQFVNDPKHRDDAFTAALLHDLGKLVIGMGMPDEAKRLYGANEACGRALVEAELAVLGGTHASVGAYVVGMWGLPLPIVEVVAHHDLPNVVGEGTWEVLAAVHAASVLVHDPEATQLDHAFLARVGLAGEIPKWLALAQKASGP